MKKLILCFLCVVLFSSCELGQQSGVVVQVAAYHKDDLVQTSSGRPLINNKGMPQFCRYRPFNLLSARERLKDEGLTTEQLDRYLFGAGSGEEGEEGEESSRERSAEEPVFIEMEDNWLKLGLVIQNNENYLLIIDSVRFQARARCGSQTFEHSGTINTGYCSGGGDTAPYLYAVPAGTQVNYAPLSPSSFDNLILLIGGFPVIDRSGEASQTLQNTVSRAVEQRTANATTVNSGDSERECRPNEILVIPQYTVELTLLGYFIVPGGEDIEERGKRKKQPTQVKPFRQRIRFRTASAY